MMPSVSLPTIVLSMQATLAILSTEDPAQEGPADPPQTLQEVRVTGSHLRRSELETAQPLLILDRERLQRTGQTDLGAILQQLPQHVSDLNTDYNNGGNGETRIDLRNLGANRTLVLLNGYRFVSALDGAVDVGSIPLAIVDRIEILADGASAIYGSDAIGGVVNIITRRDHAVAEAGMRHAGSEHGDGVRRAGDITWGREGLRGGFAVNLSYADQRPVRAGDRAISSVPIHGLPANDVFTGASPSTPDGRFGFGPSGNLLPEGGIGQTTWDDGIGGYRRFNPRQDGYNFAPDNYLRTPYQRTSLFAQARTDITPSASLRGELLLQRRRSSQELAPTPIFQFAASGAPNHAAIDTDNLYNTFGQPVTSFTFRPLNRPRRFEQDATTHHLSIGVEGLSEVASRTFDWRLNLVDARRRKDDAILGGYDLQRLALGVGPSYRDEAGTPRCGSPAAPLAGCVPLDFLHGSSGFTDMMYDHIAVAAGIHEDRRLQMASLSAGSELLSLPGGPATLAAGLEWRRERGRIDMDALLSEDSVDFGGFAPEPIDGGILVLEAWAELELPLLSPRPWAQSLSLNLAGRYSDYSSFGNTGNGKASLAWRPRSGLLLRGAWSQGYRAPSINELFAVGGVLLPEAMAIPLLDPCATPADAVVAARCRAAGVPVGFDPQQPPRIRIGSNPWLQPERARNRSLGIVWSPPKVAGLDMALDWWRIELRDTIDDIPAQELSRQCYVEAIDAACGQLQRDPATGVLVEIDARLHNNGVYEIEGFDVSLGYRRSGRFGDVEVRWDSVYLARHQRTLPAGGSSTSLVGNYATRDPGWRLRSLLSLDWRRHRFGTTVRLRHYSALDESCHVPANAGRLDLCDRPDLRSPTFGGAPEHIIRARTYVDLQLHWEPWQGASFSVGVDNASGREPPVSFNAPNSYDPAYDIPGRFWHAGWRVRF